MTSKRKQHRMLDTGFGEVCIKDVEGKNYCEAYGGDNYELNHIIEENKGLPCI